MTTKYNSIDSILNNSYNVAATYESIEKSENHKKKIWFSILVLSILSIFLIQANHKAYRLDKKVWNLQNNSAIAFPKHDYNTLFNHKYNLDHDTEPMFQNPIANLQATHPLLYLNSEKAYQQLFQSSSSYHQYFAYSLGFDAQINQAFCGIATSAAVLNSLRHFITEPVGEIYFPYHYATQVNVFQSQCVKQTSILKAESIMTPPFGTTLLQIRNLLECWLNSKQDDWEVIAYHVTNETSIQELKNIFINVLRQESGRVLINYFRQSLHQVGGGHFSPIAAYHEDTDSFLINDVAKYKYAPVFAPFETIYDSMKTIDSCGTWDFPSAQETLEDFDFNDIADLRDTNPEQFQIVWSGILNSLGCQERYRGFIIVTKK